MASVADMNKLTNTWKVLTPAVIRPIPMWDQQDLAFHWPGEAAHLMLNDRFVLRGALLVVTDIVKDRIFFDTVHGVCPVSSSILALRGVVLVPVAARQSAEAYLQEHPFVWSYNLVDEIRWTTKLLQAMGRA